MNRTTRKIITGGALALFLGTGLALMLDSTGAEAATVSKTIVVSDHVAGVPDTTVGSVDTGVYEDASGHMTTVLADSVFGPVWAIDDITNTFQVKSLGNGDYKVDRLVNGTFEGFAEPNSGPVAPLLVPKVSGQMHGTNSYVVHSVNGPVGHLAPEQATATGTYAQLKQLFPDIADSDIHGGDTWVFAYSSTSEGGSRMVQRYDTASSTWGNITG
jgi:hypothetical protein